MEKIFENFLNNREKNDALLPKYRPSYRVAEQEAFLKELTNLDVTSFGLTSFLNDLKGISDSGKLEVGEYEKFKKALIDKEKEKIKSISDREDLPKECNELTKLQSVGLLNTSEFSMMEEVIGQQVVNITKGEVKAKADKEKDKKRKSLRERFEEFLKKPKEEKKRGCGCGCFSVITGVCITLAILWTLSAILQSVFPDKRARAAAARKAAAVQYVEPAAPKIPVNTLIGYDQAVKSGCLDNIEPGRRDVIGRALRHVLLNQARKTATGNDFDRIEAECRNLPKVENDFASYIAEHYILNAKKQGVTGVKANPGPTESSYVEAAVGLNGFYDKDWSGWQKERSARSGRSY